MKVTAPVCGRTAILARPPAARWSSFSKPEAVGRPSGSSELAIIARRAPPAAIDTGTSEMTSPTNGTIDIIASVRMRMT